MGQMLALVVSGLALALVLIILFGPRHPTGPVHRVDAGSIAADPDAYLAAAEARFTDITPGTEKRIVWVDVPGQRSTVSIVVIHGFSGTSEEIRPVPDRVARALGANLYFARLAGHGRPGAAMGRVGAADWQRDLDEAMAVGRTIGDRVLIIAVSTGATLVTTRMTDPNATGDLAGVVFVSPNYRVKNRLAFLLDWPWAQHWGNWVAGPSQGFEPNNPDHALYWTTEYPTRAAVPMGALIRAARQTDLSAIRVPVLFFVSDDDTVVDARATRDVAARWGAPAELIALQMGPGDDPNAHVIIGDILSPGQTERAVADILAWIDRVVGHAAG